MSRNEQTGIVSSNAVTHVFVEQHTTDVRLLKVSDAQGNVVAITVSDEHPIFVTNKGWLFADELSAGDSLQSLAGEPLTVVSNIEDDQPLRMYNLEVANDHTYGVTDEQVWVHNADCFNPIKASNGLTYKSNTKHTAGMPGNRPNAGIEPDNSIELFEKAIVPEGGGKKMYALDENGNLNQFLSDGTNWHWAGRSGKDQKAMQILNYNDVPNDILKKFGLPLKRGWKR